MKYKDYYEALGVARDADLEAIKRAYRKLARQYHPDVSKEPDAEARFKDAAEAYATLKDADKRAAYDQLGQHRSGEDFAPPPQWQQEYAGTSPAGGFGEMDLEDLLDMLGRSRSGGAAQGPRAGRDLEATTRIRLDDAYHGATLSLDLDDGRGPRTLEVRIPAGVSDGQRLRLRGQGGKGRNGGADGDIYLHITLAPHPVFRVDRHDLYFDLALAPWEAVLGAEVEVPTLDGPVLLTVPPHTSSGRRLRLRGRGLSNGKGGRGDLYASAHIEVPSAPSDNERELWRQLAQASSFNPRALAQRSKDHDNSPT